MPLYLHQWKYKDREIHALIENPQDRGHVVSLAVEAFGGTLHNFYFCFGAYDGVAISEFPDNNAALACMMTILSQGGLATCETTSLFRMEEGISAMSFAKEMLMDEPPYQPPSRTQ